jgi:hypothetical protein
MKNPITIISAVCLFITAAGTIVPLSFSSEPTVTPVFMFLYGYGTLEAGDEIAVYTGDGILCGRSTVSDPGQYGLMAVYGNDPFSGEKDGADAGEILRIEVNGAEVIFPAGQEPRFGRDGETVQVDLD